MRFFIMKKFFLGIPKVFFAILCYLSALLLAILSGYFSIMFYAKSQTGWNMWAMGGLAGMLEFIKIMLATAYYYKQSLHYLSEGFEITFFMPIFCPVHHCNHREGEFCSLLFLIYRIPPRIFL